MTTDLKSLPNPLVPQEVDLRGYDFMPFFGDSLERSEFNHTTDDMAWRFGVMLWWEAWAKQVPAASLPNDDKHLTRACGLGRDVATFKKVRDAALHGFVLCADGRLYHKFLAKHAIEAYQGRIAQRLKTTKARIAALKKRLLEATTDAETAHVSDLIKDLEQSLSQTLSKPVTDQEKPQNTGQSQKPEGEGEGQREDKEKSSAAQPEALPVDNSTPKADTATLTADVEKPDRPTMIGHWVKYFVNRGCSQIACQKPPARELMAEWIELGVTYAQMDEFMAKAVSRLKGAIPSSPIYLKSMIHDHFEAAKADDKNFADAVALIKFDEGMPA